MSKPPPNQTNGVIIQIDRDDLEAMLKSAIRGELEHVGLFSAEAKDRQQLQQDFAWVRKTRNAFDNAAGAVGKAIIGALVLGIIGLVVAGAKVGITSPPK